MRDSDKRFLLDTLPDEVSPNGRFLMAVVMLYVNAEGACKPGNPGLCRKLGWELRTLQRAIQELKKKDLVGVSHDGKGTRWLTLKIKPKTDSVTGDAERHGCRWIASQVTCGSDTGDAGQLYKGEEDNEVLIEGSEDEKKENSSDSQGRRVSSMPSPAAVLSSPPPPVPAAPSSSAADLANLQDSVNQENRKWPAVDSLGKTPRDWERLFDEMMAAPSKGAFYHRFIKGRFPHSKQD